MHSNNKKFVVTQPDYIYDKSYKILVIDYTAQEIEDVVGVIESWNFPVVIYVYDQTENNIEWLLNVANQADIVSMNTTTPSTIDIYKGFLLSYDHAYFFTNSNILEMFTSKKSTDHLEAIILNSSPWFSKINN